MRQKAQGIEADTAFLQDEAEPLDKAAQEEAELAAAERQYQKQLAKEIGVSTFPNSFACMSSLSPLRMVLSSKSPMGYTERLRE